MVGVVTCHHVRGPPTFQCAALKNWEWPEDEAMDSWSHCLTMQQWLHNTPIGWLGTWMCSVYNLNCVCLAQCNRINSLPLPYHQFATQLDAPILHVIIILCQIKCGYPQHKPHPHSNTKNSPPKPNHSHLLILL